jgi:hypothetical protein
VLNLALYVVGEPARTARRPQIEFDFTDGPAPTRRHHGIEQESKHAALRQ